MTLFIFHCVWQSQKLCGWKSPSSERDWADGWDRNGISCSVLSVSVLLPLPEKGIIKSQRVYDVLLATDRGHYIKYFPYMDSPQSIGE